MNPRPLLAFALALAGCGGYIGSGPAPRVAIDHPLRLEIALSGAERATTEQALKWVLAGTHQVTWVPSGGEARLTLINTIKEDREMLGGTDCTLEVALTAARDSGEPLRATRAFKVEAVTSNLSVEKEKLITQGVVWALQETATQLAAPPPPVEPPPSAPPPETQPIGSDTPPPVDAASEAPAAQPTRHRRRRHRR